MAKNFYDVLGVSKDSSDIDIKKAYRKKAMQYHPDRNKGEKGAEAKFKEINEAYTTLSDGTKRKQYDTFGSAGGNPFGGGGFSGASSGGFSGFEDLFGKSSASNSGGVDMEDLFGSFGGSSRGREKPKPKPESLDFDKTYEVPIFDIILGCKIEVKGVYGQIAKLTIPASTKPGTKFRVKYFGKSEGSRKGHLLVKIEAKMPKYISDMDKGLLERIRDGVGY